MYVAGVVAQKLNELGSDLLKGHYIYNNNSQQAYIESRFAKPEKFSRNISYQLTEDRGLISQYIRIRQSVYKEVYNDDNAGEDYTDRVSHIFVATAGAGNVIGGIRLTVSTPEFPKTLPIEMCGVNIRKIFQEIDFDKVIIGEAGRSAVLPDFRGGDVCTRLQMVSKEYFIKELGAEIGFGSADAVNMRRLKKFFGLMGYKFIVREDIPVKVESSEADLYLWAIDFTADSRYVEALEAPENIEEKLTVAEKPKEFA